MPTPDYETARATLLTELGRIDSKASSLLTALTIPISVLVVAVPGRHLTTAVTALTAAGGLGVATAAILALLVLRPSLTPVTRGTWAQWADCTRGELDDALVSQAAAKDAVIEQSRRIRTKYRRYRMATDSACVSLALLVAALITGAAGQ